MSGKTSQRKGADGERELAAILQAHGYDCTRGGSLSFGEVPDLTGLPGIHCEVKRSETLRLPEWMAQAERDAKRFGDGAPAVFHRKNRQPWLVTMRLEDWLAIYVTGNISQRKLAEKYGVSQTTISRRAATEKWNSEKESLNESIRIETHQKTVEKISDTEAEIAAGNIQKCHKK